MAVQPRPTTTTPPAGYDVAILIPKSALVMGHKSSHCQTSETLAHRIRGMVSDYRAERGMAQARRIVVYLHPSGTKR